jgi:hypothetical protein
MISDKETEVWLAYTEAKFGCLPSNITRFQEKCVTLENPIALVRKIEMH